MYYYLQQIIYKMNSQEENDLHSALIASMRLNETYNSDIAAACSASLKTKEETDIDKAYRASLQSRTLVPHHSSDVTMSYDEQLQIALELSKSMAPEDAITEFDYPIAQISSPDNELAFALAESLKSQKSQKSCRRAETFRQEVLIHERFGRLIQTIQLLIIFGVQLADFTTINPLGCGFCLIRAIYAEYASQMSVDQKVDFLQRIIIEYFKHPVHPDLSIQSESGQVYTLRRSTDLSLQIYQFIEDNTLDNHFIRVAHIALRRNIFAITSRNECIIYTNDPNQDYVVIVNPGGHWFRLLYQGKEYVPAWIVELIRANYIV